MDNFNYYGIDESDKEEIDMSEYLFEEAEKEYKKALGRYDFFGTPIKPNDDFESMEYMPGEYQSEEQDRGYGM